VRTAEARFKAGETARLEPTTAQVTQGENRNRIELMATQQQVALRQLQGVLQEQNALVLQDSILPTLPINAAFTGKDTARIEGLLLTQALAQAVQVARAETHFIQAQNKPSFAVGYLNQSLIGNQVVNGVSRDYNVGYRFQGVNAAITLPLWLKPQKARLKAALTTEKATRTAYQRIKIDLAAKLDALLAQHAEQQKRLAFYEQTAMPQASLMAKLATKAYKTGETGYTEYLLHLERAYRLRTDYVDLLLLHNLTVIELDYLLTPVQ
jgi:cobalt-zinc-cadmium resistance protein CzcA